MTITGLLAVRDVKMPDMLSRHERCRAANIVMDMLLDTLNAVTDRKRGNA